MPEGTVWFQIVAINGKVVKLGVEAPASVRISRAEGVPLPRPHRPEE